MDHIGIDVHKNASQVCIRTEIGQRVERRVRTDRESFAKLLGKRPKARIVVESSTESEWVARCLEELSCMSARTEVVELMTHNAKGEVIDAYRSWEWSTLCDEITKLQVELHPVSLIVLPLAKGDTPETTPVSDQVFASDFATRDQSEMISDGYRWRRWESNSRRFT